MRNRNDERSTRANSASSVRRIDGDNDNDNEAETREDDEEDEDVAEVFHAEDYDYEEEAFCEEGDREEGCVESHFEGERDVTPTSPKQWDHLFLFPTQCYPISTAPRIDLFRSFLQEESLYFYGLHWVRWRTRRS